MAGIGPCIPSRKIAPGAKTGEPIRTRGWTYWHHLFTPRQLLVHGEFAERLAMSRIPVESKVACLLGLGRVADWDSKLARWWTDKAHEKVIQTFSNQALNTLVTFWWPRYERNCGLLVPHPSRCASQRTAERESGGCAHHR